MNEINKLKQGMQFKFFGSKQIYEIISYQRYRKYGYRNRDDRKSYLIKIEELPNIRSIFDPERNRQIAKRKQKGGVLEWFYED